MSNDIHLAYAQHHGRIAQTQQDALLAAGKVVQAMDAYQPDLMLDAATGLCAVADGVAVSPFPHLASHTALAVLQTCAAEHPDLLQDGWIGPRMIRRHIHEQLCRQLGRSHRTHGSATTLALLQWRQERFSVLNVGDSRVYRIDRDGGWRQLTKDHTYRQSMVECGEIDPGQSVGQLYNDLEHMLIADDGEDDFAVHWQQGAWQVGETFMLSTDGVHDTLGDEGLRALYRPELTVGEQVACYRKAVLGAGAPDNLSVVLLRFFPRQGEVNRP